MKAKFIKLRRDPEDPEKAVIPAIVYINIQKYDITSHVILFGWWDYSFGVALCFK